MNVPDHRFARPDNPFADAACTQCGQPEYTHPTIEDEQLAALRQLYPGWFIGPAPFNGWRAEWRSESGLSVHYVGGTTLADLHHRLEVVEAARGESG